MKRAVEPYDGREIERRPLMAPGEISIKDERYEVSARRALRPSRVKSGSERTFIGLGPVAEALLREAAAAGTSRLASEPGDIVTLELSWARQQSSGPWSALSASVAPKAADVREILAAGPQVPNPVRTGKSLTQALPEAPVRSLEAYSMEAIRRPPSPQLSPLTWSPASRRLKLARIRAIAPEVCQAAKTQRWAPDEFLRTLIEGEIASRDESNLRARLKLAGFPVRKTLEEFKVQLSSVPQATFDYLAGLEWIRARESCLLIGPAGTGKSHWLIALGHAAVEAGHRVR